jgi:hypothetical protein
MDDDTTIDSLIDKGAPSHPDCIRCQLSEAFREMAHVGGPYAEIAFLEKRKELLGY